MFRDIPKYIVFIFLYHANFWANIYNCIKKITEEENIAEG